jgi:hypothetical protein
MKDTVASAGEHEIEHVFERLAGAPPLLVTCTF